MQLQKGRLLWVESGCSHMKVWYCGWRVDAVTERVGIVGGEWRQSLGG